MQAEKKKAYCGPATYFSKANNRFHAIHCSSSCRNTITNKFQLKADTGDIMYMENF